MRLRQPFASPTAFGNTVIVAFLLAQAADGVMTYVGVTTMGPHIEANPLLVSLMAYLGQGAGVTAAKLVAAGLGISLHLVGVHRIVAALTAIYLVGAVVPWASLLLYT
jgi:hypothetical protein